MAQAGIRRPGRLALLAAAGMLATAPALLVATPAQAHNYLVSSTPAEGATLTALPERFEITTNDVLLDLGGGTGAFALQVTDADGRYYGDGCLEVAGPTMSTAAALGAAGTYTVQWQVVSADGHSVSDSFTFRWAPTEAALESVGSEQPPVCGEAGDATSGGGAGAAPDATPGGGAPGALAGGADDEPGSAEARSASATAPGASDGLWIGAAVVAVAAAGGGVLVARSRGRGAAGGRDRQDAAGTTTEP